MPEFAQADPHRFWVAADTYERKNGRAYTELQIALPRELSPEDRNQLARDATRELLGDRFAYTLAVHTPMAKDNIDQPHMHLMFSERAIDEKTRALSEEQFFKRNGAKKDPAWNDREKPFEVREKWVEMMNAAMQRAGHEQRLDPRSWAEQGREDLAALVEPKLLAGNEAEARALHAQVDQLREQRAELPHLYLPGAEAIHDFGLVGHEIFVPQSYQYGGEAQVDWYEIFAEFDGQSRKVYIFCMRSMASGAAFHRAYPHATQQAFLEAHELAFAWFGGVFRTLRFDNLTSAVKKILRGRQREETTRFIAFRSHWGFQAEFCTPGEAMKRVASRAKAASFGGTIWSLCRKHFPYTAGRPDTLNVAFP
jgi:hypothetical protein